MKVQYTDTGELRKRTKGASKTTPAHPPAWCIGFDVLWGEGAMYEPSDASGRGKEEVRGTWLR